MSILENKCLSRAYVHHRNMDTNRPFQLTKSKSVLQWITLTTKTEVIQWHLHYCGSSISVAPGYRITWNSEISCRARSQCSRPPFYIGDKLKYINRFFLLLPTTVMPLEQSINLLYRTLLLLSFHPAVCLWLWRMQKMSHLILGTMKSKNFFHGLMDFCSFRLWIYTSGCYNHFIISLWWVKAVVWNKNEMCTIFQLPQ